MTDNNNQDSIVKFDDELKDEKKADGIDDEVVKIISTTKNLIGVLEKITKEIHSDKILNEQAFLKIIKPLTMNVENSLPQLMEVEDNLLYLQDERAYEIRSMITHLEDDLLAPLLDYIKEVEAKGKKD